jgi:hypothetical protein
MQPHKRQARPDHNAQRLTGKPRQALNDATHLGCLGGETRKSTDNVIRTVGSELATIDGSV